MKYLSPSRVSLFNQCALSFRNKYIESVGFSDETTDYYANYGTLFHDIAESIAKKRILFLDQAFREFDSRFPTCGIPDNMRSDYYVQGKKGIENKFNELSKLNIVGVEIEFTETIDFSIPPIHGFIDLVYQDEKGRLIVRDYKTSKVYSNSILKKQLQPYFYAIACYKKFGVLPFKFEFDYVRFDETRDMIVTDDFYKMGVIKIIGAWNKMKSGVYEPNYNPFFCQNFCESKSICALYMKKNGY